MIVIYDILYCTVIAQPRRPTAEVRSTVIVAVAVSVPTTFTDCRPRIPSYTTVTSAIGVFFCSKRNYAHPTTNPNEKKISRSVFLNLGPRVLRSHLGFRYYSFFVLLVSSPMEILLQGRKHLFDSVYMSIIVYSLYVGPRVDQSALLSIEAQTDLTLGAARTACRQNSPKRASFIIV